MTPEHFDALFDTFHTTAARLETLPAYQVADYEGDRLEAFLAGRPLPVRSISTDPWLARIARTTMDGKRWWRLRVVDDPLTDYERFELTVFAESQAVGEHIRVVPRRACPDPESDFWLFDGDTPAARAVVMRYDAAGHWLGADLVDDPDTVAAYRTSLGRLQSMSVELNEFLARHG